MVISSKLNSKVPYEMSSAHSHDIIKPVLLYFPREMPLAKPKVYFNNSHSLCSCLLKESVAK